MRRTLLVLALLAASLAGCGLGHPDVKLRVLASSDLGDMGPILRQLRSATGVDLQLDDSDTVDSDAAQEIASGRYDMAWLSSDRYLQLGHDTEQVPSTDIMTSPVVIGMKHGAAERLHHDSDGRVSWADFASAAAAGTVRFGMADPRHVSSGLYALVGVATAAASTGQVLRAQDVSCDRLSGFFTGQTLTATTSAHLVDQYVAHQDDTDALVGYESVIMSLNASKRLREPLDIIYPDDGIVLSRYPLMLLRPGQRTAYDRVVRWLTSRSAQTEIMNRTWRRPADPAVPRDSRLSGSIGNSLYFPGSREVIDKLLQDYGSDATTDRTTIFLLDFSASMSGARIADLRSAFDGLTGQDTSAVGKFVRFHVGERFTLVRFGGSVLGESTFTIGGPDDVSAMQTFLSAGGFDGRTAVWTTLEHGYQLAAASLKERPQQPVSIVLMTDGESNAGDSPDDFLRQYGALPAGVRAVHTYAIRFGEADPAVLDRVARQTGGHLVDADASSLRIALEETRGCG